jgi:DNA-binding response OmpR family regulator
VPSEADWREGARLAVQRARDLARYVGAQSVAASGSDPDTALAALRRDQARRAQRAFEALRAEAEARNGGAMHLEPEPLHPTAGRVTTGDLVIDLDIGAVTHRGEAVRLGPTERAILSVLVANPGRAVSREALIQAVYGADPELDARNRTIDVHVFNLRRKLGQPDWLTTVPGVGFRSTVSSLVSEDVAQVRERRREQRRAWAAGDPPAAARGDATAPATGALGQEPPPSRPERGRVTTGDLTIDLDRQVVTRRGSPVPLGNAELTILTVLVANPGRVVTREELASAMSGADSGGEAGRSLDTTVWSLRRKLGHPGWLTTVYGVGYRSTAEARVTEDPAQVRKRRREQRELWAAGSAASPPPPAVEPSHAVDGPSPAPAWQIRPRR